jgi:hypothetical protein
MLKKKNIFYIIFVLSFILLIILSFLSIREIKRQKMSSKAMQNAYDFQTNSPFSINKIVYFSSANCNSKINPNSSFTISDLYQYTDIAIFINNNADGNFDASNTLKNLSLSDIKFILQPSIGTPNLYFKNINNFASNSFEENNKIGDNLQFNISSQDEIDYSTPTLFNNCANPITLCYVNSGLKSDYTLTDNISNISYDGSLLKNCSITLNSIACKLSFLITITNNLDEIYTCPVILNIPLSTESTTIYNGNLILNNSTNYNFLRVK